MTTLVPLSEAKDKLSGLVDEVERTHEIYTITRHGRPAAVLMAVEDLESMEETLFWMSQPGIHESIAEAEKEYASGTTVSGEQVRVEAGLPLRGAPDRGAPLGESV